MAVETVHRTVSKLTNCRLCWWDGALHRLYWLRLSMPQSSFSRMTS